MKKLFNIILRYPLMMILIVIITPILVNILVIAKNPILKIAGDANGWIGFFGNYFGGLIGGLTALIISRVESKESQLALRKETIEQQKLLHRDEKMKQYFALIFLKDHIEKFINALNFINNLYNSTDVEHIFSNQIKFNVINDLNNIKNEILKSNPSDPGLIPILNLEKNGFMNLPNSKSIKDYIWEYKKLNMDPPFAMVRTSLEIKINTDLYDLVREVTNLSLKNKLLKSVREMYIYKESFDSSIEEKNMQLCRMTVEFNKISRKANKSFKDNEYIKEYLDQQTDFISCVVERGIIINRVLFDNLLDEYKAILKDINDEIDYTNSLEEQSIA